MDEINYKLHTGPAKPKKLSQGEIETLQKKGRIIYRPQIDENGNTQVGGREYAVGSDGVWRLGIKRVRQSKKARLKARRAKR